MNKLKKSIANNKTGSRSRSATCFNYQSLILLGFRATGKSTLGKMLAQKIGWDFIDMDNFIEEKTKLSINQLTKEGTDWQKFRQIELDTLQKLILKKNTIIAPGGGLAVNDIFEKKTNKTFGQLAAEFLKKQKNICLILLQASDEIIAHRIKQDEILKINNQRPILDQKKAQEIKKQFFNSKEVKKKALIDNVIISSLEVLQKRKTLYHQLTKKVINTEDDFSICVKKMKKYLQR